MSEFILLITGSPGVGKSATARALAEELGCVSAEEKEVLSRALVEDLTGRDAMVIEEERARQAIREFVESVRDCYVVSTLHPELWVSAAEEHIAVIVLLRVHPKELMRRLLARGWGRRKVVENVLAEAFNVIAEEIVMEDMDSFTVELDATAWSSPQVSEVIEKLSSWDVGVRLDWLSDPEALELASRLTRELDLYEGR